MWDHRISGLVENAVWKRDRGVCAICKSDGVLLHEKLTWIWVEVNSVLLKEISPCYMQGCSGCAWYDSILRAEGVLGYHPGNLYATYSSALSYPRKNDDKTRDDLTADQCITLCIPHYKELAKIQCHIIANIS